MSLAGGALAKQAGAFGWGYNKVNYKFDQRQRWSRYLAGRQNEIKRFAMFREDISDLASVTGSKLKVYAPVLTMSLGYCLTVLVEARSGLKFPAPPTFASGLYLQCLGVAFAFMTLAIWLCFHAAQKAQVAAVQIRTRRCRLPVPTQRQLDSARKILSTYEEQNIYDIFRLPFVMPNAGANPPMEGEDLEGKKDEKGAYKKAGLIGVAAKVKGKMKDLSGEVKELGMPGLTSGAPSWIEKEMEQREEFPKGSPSAFGMEAASEPYEHFELVRQAQKDYWCAEAYTRVAFLIGMMHLIQAFCYWLVIHMVAELAMVWCSVIVAGALQSAVWLMFRLDVLPDHGGFLPIEGGGPFIEAISLALAYTHHPSQGVIDVSRAVAIIVYLMQMGWTLRLYVVSQPMNSAAGVTHEAREAGGRLFNQSASCETPIWLPASFQHVSYLVAPPKTAEQQKKERQDREGAAIKEDPLVNVDMSAWYYMRVLLFITFLGWSILLTGRIVECIMGERMLVTNPGAPPWTRVGQWYGWESGPISSKHYAHVTPQKGHFAWQKGWGPNGQQELWPSDMFGMHPEADMHWSEDQGPEPVVAAAGMGVNTWHNGVIKYARRYEGLHDWLDSAGHRRLRSIVPGQVRPVVPAAVHWPALLEPEFLACGPEEGQVAALGAGGMGALMPAASAGGMVAGHAAPFSLEGLLELGMTRGASWGRSSRLLVSTGTGKVAACPVASAAGRSQCLDVGLPKLPSYTRKYVASVVDATDDQPFRAAVVAEDGRVLVHELVSAGVEQEWKLTADVLLPLSVETQVELPEIVSVAASHNKLVVTTKDGTVFQWTMSGGQLTSEASRESPAAGPRRNWHSACVLHTGKILRLASSWQRHGSGTVWQPELLA